MTVVVHRVVHVLAVLAIALVAAVPVAAGALDAPGSEATATETGRTATLLEALGGWSAAGGLFGVGFDVTPLRPVLSAAPAEDPRDPRSRVGDPGRAISFDLRLRWPSALGETGGTGALQPYVAVGPALLVAESDDPLAVLADRPDVTLSLGVRAGAGVTWRLDRNATLFGEYRFTRGGDSALAPLGGAARDVSGYDFLYGVRLRF